MTRSLIFRPLAEAEYLGAAAFYEDERAGLGTEFESEVQAVLDTIASHPDRYPVAVRDIREAPTHRFPYCVYYRVRGDRIMILSVFHQSRDPSEWQSRS